jgi:hypothetical protein
MSRVLSNRVKLCYVCGDLRNEFSRNNNAHVDFDCMYFEVGNLGYCTFLKVGTCSNKEAVEEYKKILEKSIIKKIGEKNAGIKK